MRSFRIGRRRVVATLAFGAALASTVTACGGSGGSASTSGGSGEQLTLGVTLPLTGETADFGTASQHGVMLAVEQLNAKGGVNGKPIKAVYEDTVNDAAKSVTAFTKLTSVNHAPVVLSGTSAGILAQGPLAARNSTVLFNAGASTPKMRDFGSGKFFFSDINDSDVEADDIAKYVKNELHPASVAMVYSNEPIGEGARSAFQAAAERYGIKIGKQVALNADNHDYRAQVAELKGAHPSVVIAASYYEPLGFFLKEAAQQNLDTTWIGGQTTLNPSTLKTAGAGAEGYLTIRPSFDAQVAGDGDNPSKQFEAEFVKRFHTEPTSYSAHYYDATMMVAKAVQETKSTDAETIAEALRKYDDAHPYQGVAGPVAFDKDGMVHQPESMFAVKDGQVVPVGS